MDKWYIETGTIKEVVLAEDSADAFKDGLEKGLDRANHYEAEYSLSELIVASQRGFISDDPTVSDDAMFNSTANVLRNIGQDEIAMMLEEVEDTYED